MENPDEELTKLRMINENLQKLLADKQKTINTQDKLLADYREKVIFFRKELRLMDISYSEN